MPNEITDVRFFEGGDAIFTVSNTKGEHYTYRISKHDPKKPFYIYLLTGPDNMSDYTYMGVYNPLYRTAVITKASTYNLESLPVRVLQWAIHMVASKTAFPTGYSCCHEGRCCRCGHRLTTTESIERGIGPECAERSGW